MAQILYRLGRFAARRAWAVVAAWAAVLLVALGGTLAFGGQLTNAITVPGTETQRLSDRLQEELPDAAHGTGQIVFSTLDGRPFTGAQQEQVASALEDVEDLDGVDAALNPFSAQTERTGRLEQLEDGRQEIGDTARDLDDAQARLDAGQEQLDDARRQAERAADSDDEQAAERALEDLAERQSDLDRNQDELEDGRAELEAAREELERGEALTGMAEEFRTVSADDSAALAVVTFTETQQAVSTETKDALQRTVRDAELDGVRADFSLEIAQDISQLFGPAEVVGVAVAGIVLFAMLGTVVAAGLPIVTAITGVAVGALAVLSFSGVVDLASVTPMLGLMLGLAVGIDYSLFVLNRHRRQLLDGAELRESIGLANGTSGNAVCFAGLTVIIALAALNLTGIPFLGVMGTAGAVCVAVAVLIAVTLTPALLSLIGPRVLTKRLRERAGHAAPRHLADAPSSWAGLVTRHRGLALVTGVLALALLALPVPSMRLGLPDASSEPAGSTQHRAYEVVAEKFGAGSTGPLLVVADLPEDAGEQDARELQVVVGQALMEQDDVVAVVPAGISEDFDTLVYQVVPTEGAASASTEQLVTGLRAHSAVLEDEHGVSIGVTGQTGGNIDVSRLLADALPLYLTVVLGLSLVLMMLVFRSVLVPLIATAGFLLSFLAAMGAVVAIYQWGWLGALFGVQEAGPVLSFLPTILVGVLFGLAMDYQLFLTTGMREAWVHGRSARDAVVEGFDHARTVVTAAALIMTAVFAGFVFSHMAMVRPIGFGLAFGVLVDAFVVRMTLVPAAMHLLGERAWWLPKWLDRLMPDVDVEGQALERAHGSADAPATAPEQPAGTSALARPEREPVEATAR